MFVSRENRSSARSSVGKSVCLLSRGSGVRVPPGAPLPIFRVLKDQVERLSDNTCGVYRAVRKHNSEQLRIFDRRLLKINKVRLICEL